MDAGRLDVAIDHADPLPLAREDAGHIRGGVRLPGPSTERVDLDDLGHGDPSDAPLFERGYVS